MDIYSGLTTLQCLSLNPKEGIPSDLYFKGRRVFPSPEGLVVDKGGVLDLGTYFNLFSWDKWQLYTGLESLSLILNIKGSCVVTISSRDEKATVLDTSVITVLTSGEVILDVPEKLFAGKLTVQVEAKSPCILMSGCWASVHIPYKHKVRIAAVFCTFNRDEYLFENLDTIAGAGTDALDVFVIDNASRLDEETLYRKNLDVQLFHNPNVGGSGGFTKGIIEALTSHKEYTHVLLMDDDIRIEGETLRRTESLLSCLKPRYEKYFLSGAMMLLDQPRILFESTARWNGVRVTNYKKDLDLSDLETLCSSDKDVLKNNKYAAWWYCAIPLSLDMGSQLPFPFFVYGDDMDYSLKRADGFITMNGLSVWHEPFTRKFSPVMKSYFFCRNTLILNSIHSGKYNPIQSVINAWAHFMVQIFVHDYRSAALALDAYDDFLEGAEYITALNEQDLLNEKHRSTDFKVRSEKELKNTYKIPASFKRWRSPWYFMHSRLAVFDHEGTQAEIRCRKWKQIVSLSLRFWKLNLSGLYRFYPASRSYKNLQCNLSFWQNRLEAARLVRYV